MIVEATGEKNLQLSSVNAMPLKRDEVVEVKSGSTWYAATVLCVKGKKVQILWKTGELDEVHINRVRRPHEMTATPKAQIEARDRTPLNASRLVLCQTPRATSVPVRVTAQEAATAGEESNNTSENIAQIITPSLFNESIGAQASPLRAASIAVNDIVEARAGKEWYRAKVLSKQKNTAESEETQQKRLRSKK